MATTPKIVMIACDDDSTCCLYNYLKKDFEIVTVIEERKTTLEVIQDKYRFLKRRVVKLGFCKVLGQLLFVFFIVRPLKRKSQDRINTILGEDNLDRGSIPKSKITSVKSVNSQKTIDTLKSISPDAIVINGTRIISSKVIDSAGCKLFNIHAGITPKYRGVYGMYWALVNKDYQNCGITVHFIDKGIDTGCIIYQELTVATESDNVVTYIYLQIKSALPKLKQAINEYLDGTLQLQKGPQESHLYSHPTIWEYFKNGVK